MMVNIESTAFEKGHFQKNTHWLGNYAITPQELLRSVVVSEYAFRHLAEAKASGKLSHYIICVLEFIPILGGIASLIEGIAAKIFKPKISCISHLTLPHEMIPDNRKDLQKIQKTVDQLGMPLHVLPKTPTPKPLKTQEIQKFKEEISHPDYDCYCGDNVPMNANKNLLMRAADLFQHISMEDLNSALPACIEELNTALKNAGNPAYAVGFNCGKSSQWVTSLALKDLRYLPEDWGDTPVNVGIKSFAQAGRPITDAIPDTLVLFDDCSYSGEQIYNILFSILNKMEGYEFKSLNKFRRIFVVIPFMSEGAINRVNNGYGNSNVQIITSSTRIKAFKDSFTEDEISLLKDTYVIHTPTNKYVLSFQGRYLEANQTVCYTDWRTLPDSVSFFKPLGKGIKRSNNQGDIEVIGKFNPDPSDRPYQLSEAQLSEARSKASKKIKND